MLNVVGVDVFHIFRAAPTESRTHFYWKTRKVTTKRRQEEPAGLSLLAITTKDRVAFLQGANPRKQRSRLLAVKECLGGGAESDRKLNLTYLRRSNIRKKNEIVIVF